MRRCVDATRLGVGTLGTPYSVWAGDARVLVLFRTALLPYRATNAERPKRFFVRSKRAGAVSSRGQKWYRKPVRVGGRSLDHMHSAGNEDLENNLSCVAFGFEDSLLCARLKPG